MRKGEAGLVVISSVSTPRQAVCTLCKYSQGVSEYQRKAPLLAKNARNGAPGFAQTAKGGPPDSRNRFIDPSTRKGRGSQDDKAVFKVWVSAGA
jgi:hypothetical protein